MPDPAEPRVILFFDGVCGLCNAVIDFLLAHDHRRRLRFAPLQGETFQALAREEPWLREIDSVIVVRERPGRPREFFVHSRAAIFAFGQLGGPWLLVGLLGWVPRALSDAAYRLVARVRYALFGKRELCRIPTPGERSLFLP